ncbi:hypothetical protein AAC387_Pa02g3184 [Persea americana]
MLQRKGLLTSRCNYAQHWEMSVHRTKVLRVQLDDFFHSEDACMSDVWGKSWNQVSACL